MRTCRGMDNHKLQRHRGKWPEVHCLQSHVQYIMEFDIGVGISGGNHISARQPHNPQACSARGGLVESKPYKTQLHATFTYPSYNSEQYCMFQGSMWGCLFLYKFPNLIWNWRYTTHWLLLLINDTKIICTRRICM